MSKTSSSVLPVTQAFARTVTLIPAGTANCQTACARVVRFAGLPPVSPSVSDWVEPSSLRVADTLPESEPWLALADWAKLSTKVSVWADTGPAASESPLPL